MLVYKLLYIILHSIMLYQYYYTLIVCLTKLYMGKFRDFAFNFFIYAFL